MLSSDEETSELTPAMIRAGEDIVLSETGGADLGAQFSASALAVRVYQAMQSTARGGLRKAE